MLANLVNIIVVGYGPKVKHLDKACLNSILFNTSHPYIITYFDNYASGMSLTAVWNKLVKFSDTKFICLLNNDTRVTENWLGKLVDTLTTDERIGFVGPSGNCHSVQSSVVSEEHAQKHIGKVVMLKDPPSGFCLLFRKKIWDEINGFNEQYNLYGSESDFCDRATKVGYKYAWRKDVFIHHLGESSSKAYAIDTIKEREKAKKLYWESRDK